MNRYLSISRLGRLLTKDLTEGYRTIFVVVGAVTGVLLLNYLVGAVSDANSLHGGGIVPHSGENSTMHMVYFTLVLLIGGFIISSRSFMELHTKTRNHDWLMLPASTFEKFLSRLLVASVGVGVGSVVYFFLFSLLAGGLSALLFGRPYTIFNPFDGTVWMLVLRYVVLQSVFFAGAAYFKKAHFIKTVLVLSGFGFVLLLLTAGIARLVFWREFAHLVSGAGFANFDMSVLEPRLQSAGEIFLLVSRILFWAVLAPVMWVFAYLRLAEAEVRNGV